jgi:hypothetical protein
MIVRALQWGLGLLAWALTPASAGPRQQSTVQDIKTDGVGP